MVMKLYRTSAGVVEPGNLAVDGALCAPPKQNQNYRITGFGGRFFPTEVEANNFARAASVLGRRLKLKDLQDLVSMSPEHFIAIMATSRNDATPAQSMVAKPWARLSITRDEAVHVGILRGFQVTKEELVLIHKEVTITRK